MIADDKLETPTVEQDAAVKALLADLEHVAKTQEYPAAMARVAETIRTRSTATDFHPIRPDQKAELLRAVEQAYYAIYATVPAENAQGQVELNVGISALRTLVMVWADDDEVWNRRSPGIRDTHDFVHAFEHEMAQYAILDLMVERRRSAAADLQPSE